MKKFFFFTLIAAFLAAPLNGCIQHKHADSTILASVEGRLWESPVFIPRACWFEIPERAKVSCGYVIVQEDRSQMISPSNAILLAVAIFHSSAAHPAPDPIVYQVGGPGGHMLAIVPYIYDKVIAPFLESRDLILFDPRGTGYSQPALECSRDEEPGDCIRRHFSEGRNMHAYNSSSSAADLQDIRSALGYDEWNLLGESYGTHVAQIAIREQPEGLRSVILDSVVPVVKPQLPNGETSFETAFHRLISRCKSDPDCRRNYPDLDNQFARAVMRLNSAPVKLFVDAYGKQQVVTLTGERMKEMVFHALYETDITLKLPQAITCAADGGDYNFFHDIVRWEYVIEQISSQGVYWSVLCGDGKLSDCVGWPLAIEVEPVQSDLPVLILSGEFDPVTPVEYGHVVAEHLPKSFVFDFPGPLDQWHRAPLPKKYGQSVFRRPIKSTRFCLHLQYGRSKILSAGQLISFRNIDRQ
jgi:pimeloyl-ACP methyl ester carboxylesterase